MNSFQKATRNGRFDDPPKMPTLIHRIIRPQPDPSSLLENYFRSDHPAGISVSENGMQFRRGVIASTDTVFNGLRVEGIKETADLSLVLKGRGKFLVRLGLHQVSAATRLLGETTVELDDSSATTLPVGEWGSVVAGLLFFSMEALEDGNLTEAFYETSDSPTPSDKLDERDMQLVAAKRMLSSVTRQNRVLNEVVESAKTWQKKFWLTRALHRWRSPTEPVKIGRLRSLERSIRKRRKKRLKQPVSADSSTASPHLDLIGFSKEIQVFTSKNPRVSVILPVYGQLEYTLRCLNSIAWNPPGVEFEVIVINDCSPDDSGRILRNVKGIHVLDNATNLGFIRSSNAGASAAKGEYLYFLNNDTQVTPGWMDELLLTFERFPGTGLAGSKLVYPNGKLQEAGGIIWQDGSAWNFGRNKDPKLPLYNYAREVDYCSGASIMVPRELFFSMGGFDEHYLPAYCEDSDLALKIRDKGFRVIYQPLSEVVHFEGVSSGTDTSTGVKAYQVENMKKVYVRWQHRLANHQPNAVDVDNAKDRAATKRALFLDQCTPTPDMDSGSIDAFNTMVLLRDMGFQVTFIPVSNFSFDRKYTTALQSHGIEVLYRPYVSSLKEHLRKHGNRYDLILGCRHNTLEPHYGLLRKYCLKAKIIFHTVDLHFLRMQREAELKQSKKHHDAAKEAEAAELRLIDSCDRTTVVSHVEHEVLSKMNRGPKVRVMPYSRHLRGSRLPFEKRGDLVFIGGFQHHPNIDAVQFFVSEVMPLLRPRVPGVVLHVVGSRVPPEIATLQCADVVIHGFVEDLDPLLDQMRVSIAPLRYGAGIKGKIGTAMTAGLPVVATTIAAEGMLLTHGENIMVADDPGQLAAAVAELYLNEGLWNKISSNGLILAEQEWGAASAWRILQGLLTELDMKIPEPTHPISLYSERSLGNS